MTSLRATFAFTIISALHYILLVGQRLHTGHEVHSSMSARGGV
jgi:hypothetical protein